jgi:3-methyladenine DNA glycosylase AlkC
MVSDSAKGPLQDRMKEFLEKSSNLIHVSDEKSRLSFFQELHDHYALEYEKIPESERLGKGGFYLVKSTENILWEFLKQYSNILSQFIDELFVYAEKTNDNILQFLPIFLYTNFMIQSPSHLQEGWPQVERWADNPNWVIRECAGVPVRTALKKYPEITLQKMMLWIMSQNENLRRITAECLRPLADIKWLRDPNKNTVVFKIAQMARADPSEYVRKSVGNIMKDLSKYMPEKVLDWADHQIKDAKINVTFDLASKTKSEIGNVDFLLIWTLKHALRWLQERNPEFHPRIANILGENYCKYFNEKKNWTAKPI